MRSVDDARAAMAADIGESAQLGIVATCHDYAFTAVIERVPIASCGNIALVADNLPARAEYSFEFQCEELRIAIGPCRQAPPCERILQRRFPDLCCHEPFLAIRSYNKMQINHQPAFTRADPDERRQSLIEATARVLASKGAAGVSVRAICAEAGVSPGLMRHYFSGVDRKSTRLNSSH